MDRRKRRYELITTTMAANTTTPPSSSNTTNSTISNLATELVGSLNTARGNGILLSSSSSSSIVNGGSSTAAIPSNVFLTICDDGLDDGLDDDDDDGNSDESQEFIEIDESILAAHLHKMGQDHNLNIMPMSSSSSSAFHEPIANTTIQYRMVNMNNTGQQQQQQQQNRLEQQQQAQRDFTTTLASLPASVQLPSGCEIYLLKQYSEPSVNQKNNNGTQSTEFLQNQQQQQPQQQHHQHQETLASIKLEPDVIDFMNSSGGGSVSDTSTKTNKLTTANLLVINNNNHNNNNHNSGQIHLASSSKPGTMNQHIPTLNGLSTTSTTNNSTTFNTIKAEVPPSPHASIVPVPIAVEVTSLQKRNVEAYKKRDDKRRATHNEVERRRRDKINHWIFKLKEMLPGGDVSAGGGVGVGNNQWQQVLNNLNVMGSSISSSTSSSTASSRATATNRCNSNTSNSNTSNNNSNTPPNGRLPPSDSKSQILIKACDYIKTMQGELNGLRECLKENESLRIKNQRLEFELDTLRRQLQLQQQHHNKNIVPSSSFVTLNALNGTGDLFGGIDTASTVDITKRDLIIGISDYVD